MSNCLGVNDRQFILNWPRHRCPCREFRTKAVLALAVLSIGCTSGESTKLGLDARAKLFHNSAQRVLPACVTVEAIRGARALPSWKTSNGERVPQSDNAAGSGVIIDERGYILTCAHVVSEAEAVLVKLSTGERFEAVQVISDSSSDLSILKIESNEKLPVASFGDSDALRPGDWVVSVASPYGLHGSLSGGIVSAIDRELPEVAHARLIQTDAASNPGSSGGALVDLQGNVVGICEGSYGASEGFHGITFAIPANLAQYISSKLINEGAMNRGYLGCTSETLTPRLAKSLGLSSDTKGVILTEVKLTQPAALAGLREGDVITHFDGVPICDSSQMLRAVQQAIPGKEYSVQVLRNHDVVAIKVTPVIRSLPRNTQPTASPESFAMGLFSDKVLGIELDSLTAESAVELGYSQDTSGVLIVNVRRGTAAFAEGLCAGMVIVRLGDQATPDIEAYKKAIGRQNTGSNIVALVATPEGRHHVALKLATATEPASTDLGRD